MEEILGMSNKEIERLKIISDIIEGKITQVVAGKKLKLSDRQVRRLINGIEKEINKGIISKKRGIPSNRSLSKSFKSQVMSLVVPSQKPMTQAI